MAGASNETVRTPRIVAKMLSVPATAPPEPTSYSLRARLAHQVKQCETFITLFRCGVPNTLLTSISLWQEARAQLPEAEMAMPSSTNIWL